MQPGTVVPASQVTELLQTLVKAMRAFKMYLPNNPIYAKARQNIVAAFEVVWAGLDELPLKVSEMELHWDEELVYTQPNKADSLAWALYKDGLRLLVLRPGCEQGEMVRFLETVNRARFLPPDAGDDLLTLLWEQEFDFVQYRFADIDAGSNDGLSGSGGGTSWAIEQGGANEGTATSSRRTQVREEAEAAQAARPKGVVDIEDFDSTLYFLDDAEIQLIAQEMETEYRRDVRTSAIAALFDIFESQPDDAVRMETLGILDGLFPGLMSHGEFRTVAWVLRETRQLALRAPQMTTEQRRRLEDYESQLSQPAILGQLVQSLDESAAIATDGDVTEVMKELRPAALETLVSWVPRVQRQEVRTLLERAVDRLAQQYPNEVHRLLKTPGSDAIPGLVALCGRLKLTGAIGGLADTAVQHPDPAVRLGAVQALGEIATPAAMQGIEKALDDGDRGVRLAAVRVLGARGYKGALRRVEQVVLGKNDDRDLTEKMAFFEAYGSIAGTAGLEALSNILLPRGLFGAKAPSELRACAAMAIGRIRSAEAKAILQKALDDKDVVVKNAVTKALRSTVT